MGRMLIIKIVSFMIPALVIGLSVPVYSAEKRDDRNNLDKVLGKNSKTKELKGELLITASEEKAIKQLQKLLNKHKGTSLEVSLWFRLAELYLRRSKTARFFEMNRDSDSIVKFAPQKVTKLSSKKYITQGIEIYEKIQSRFPHFRDMDLVLFNNAFARQQIGQLELAKNVYKKLLKLYPESQLVPDTNLALGEMLYDEHQYVQSLEYFNAIRKYPQSIVYPYGLYKAAWAYYNSQNTAKGLKNLEEVVAFSNQREKTEGSHKLDLKREALSDMALFFSELYPSTKAVAYFSEHANRDEIGVVLLKLAGLYGHHSKFPDLEIVLNNFIDKYPVARERSKAHYELINTYETLKARGQAVAEMRRLESICQPSSNWFEAHMATIVQEKENNYDCQKLLANASSTLAKKWHTAWLKNKNDQNTGDAAEVAYEIYLALIKKDAQKDDKYVRALYSQGDLLFQRKKYRTASEKYYEVATLSKDKKVLHDAPYAAIVSLEKAVDNKWSDEDEKQFQVLSQLYLKHNPKGAYATEVRFESGFIAYEKGRFDEAGKSFIVLAQMTPADGKVLKAQDLYLDILNTKKDYTQLKHFAFEWSKKAPADRKEKLLKIYQQSYFSEIQRTEEQGKLSDAAAAYKKFTEENQNSALADKSLWNALQLEYKINDLSNAAESGHQFFKMYPRSPKAKEALIKSAQTFEFIGQIKRAADVLDDLANIDNENAEKWANIASDFRFLNQDFKKARAGYSKLTSSKDAMISANAVLKLMSIERQTNNQKALQKLESLAMARRYESFYGQKTVDWLNALYDKKSYKSAFDAAREVLNDKRHTAKTRAAARYIQAKILDSEFKEAGLKTSPERLTLVLKIKTEKLEKAQLAFKDVIKYGEPEYIVYALRDLSLSYDHYVKAVRNITFTKPLPKAEMDALSEEFEKVTLPMEDKAVETITQAIDNAKKLQMRDGTLAQLQNILNSLNLKPTLNETEVRAPARVVPLLIGVGS